MRIAHLTIENYRGISKADILLPKHAVLIGDNNTGKTTILEALDLVLGPDRLKQQPPIDEHDFFRGMYMAAASAAPAEGLVDAAGESPQISITATIADLTDEQKAKFGDYVEFWDSSVDEFYEEADPTGVDPAHITEALRVTFHGRYDEEEDDFEGQTYFTRSLTEDERPEVFSRRHKQVCGFLYLRSRRTGSRALSLERGSLRRNLHRLGDLPDLEPDVHTGLLLRLHPDVRDDCWREAVAPRVLSEHRSVDL